MKLTGFLLLLAGWGLVLTAVVLFSADLPRTGFVLTGICVEMLGLVLVVRGHPLPRGGKA